MLNYILRFGNRQYNIHYYIILDRFLRYESQHNMKLLNGTNIRYLIGFRSNIKDSDTVHILHEPDNQFEGMYPVFNIGDTGISCVLSEKITGIEKVIS